VYDFFVGLWGLVVFWFGLRLGLLVGCACCHMLLLLGWLFDGLWLSGLLLLGVRVLLRWVLGCFVYGLVGLLAFDVFVAVFVWLICTLTLIV
jgi:hypothetical protein